LRLIDAWDPNSEILASRSLFAHCLIPGVRDIILLSDQGTNGSPVPYTLTCKISTMYSIYQKSTGKFELEDRVEPPVLYCPSKVSMIHCVVVGCKFENTKLKPALFDPFVAIQVLGIPSDSRDMRTPKASSCSQTKTAGGIGGEEAHAQADQSNYATWMFPLVITFAWSEFAFLRLSLRSHTFVDVDTGEVVGSASGHASRRRSSIFRSNPTPASAQLAVTQAPATSSSDIGFPIGKSLLWVDSVRPGYRSVPLVTERSPEIHIATLLCHFTIFEAQSRTFGPNQEQELVSSVTETVKSSTGVELEV